MSLLRPRSPYLYVLPSFLSCEEHIACCQFRAAINRLASKCEFDLRGCCQQPAPQCAQRQGSPALSARQTFRVYRYRHWDQNRHRFLRLRRSVPMQASIDSEIQNLISLAVSLLYVSMRSPQNMGSEIIIWVYYSRCKRIFQLLISVLFLRSTF